MEVSLACSDAEQMADFFERMLGATTVLRGSIGGEPYVRVVLCGVTFVFRQDPSWPGSPDDPRFRNHLGFKVDDLAAAVAELEQRGAQFVFKPDATPAWDRAAEADADEPFVRTTFVAPPLTLESLADGGYHHEVAILRGPDGLLIELNEVRLPAGVDWY